MQHEPALAAAMGLDSAGAAGSLTPVEQDQLPPDQPLEAVLESIMWPPAGHRLRRGRRAAGAAAGAPTGRSPTTRVRPQEFAREHPDRQEVRIVAGATRAGATYCALRLRAHDDDQSVVGGADLVPATAASC